MCRGQVAADGQPDEEQRGERGRHRQHEDHDDLVLDGEQRLAIPRLKGATLLGGRRCSLWGQKVALTFYEAHGKRLSLFIVDRARFPSPVAQGSRCTAAIGDYRVCLLPAGETVLAMVGDGEQTAAMLGALEDAVGARARSEPQ